MADNEDNLRAGERNDYGRSVAGKEARKLRARQTPPRSVWFWLGMMGLVGWSVAAPTMIGVAVGVWVDRTWPSGVSWTLMCLIAGAIMGSITAWYWVKRESQRR